MTKLKNLLVSILFLIVACIPILGVVFVLVFFDFNNTLMNWTNHRKFLWITNINKVKITICNGNGKDTLYHGKFNGLSTCSDSEDKDLLFLSTIPIKYINIIDNETLGVQLWNQRKRKQTKIDLIAKKYAESLKEPEVGKEVKE